MSLLDKLGIDTSKRKKNPIFSNYLQKQEYLKAQAKKDLKAKELKTAQIKTPVHVRECPVCQKPMNVPQGTIQHCHAECKPRFKRAVRRLAKSQ